MDTFTASTDRHRLQEALIDFALMTRTPTHWVTLNTHREISDDSALRRLKRWRVEMLRRLHGQRFFRLPAQEQFQFTGSRELSLAGHAHFHLACAIPADLTDRFMRHAEKRWKSIAPSGTCFIALVDADPDSPRRILSYAFKSTTPNSSLSLVDSRLFR